MLGSNPSADSVASTDVGGCCGIPLSSVARKRANHRERHSSVKSWGRGGKGPAGCARRPIPTVARAPSHNAYVLRGKVITRRRFLHLDFDAPGKRAWMCPFRANLIRE